MKPIDNYRQLLTVSIEQMNTAAAIVTSLRNQGIFKVSQPPTLFNKPGMFDSTFTRTMKNRLDDHLADHRVFSEYKIRYGVATLLASIADSWTLSLAGSIETLTELLVETKPSVDQMLHDHRMNTGPYDADNFNVLLLRFTACVLYNYVIPSNKMPKLDEPIEDINNSIVSQFASSNEFSSMAGRLDEEFDCEYEQIDPSEMNLSAETESIKTPDDTKEGSLFSFSSLLESYDKDINAIAERFADRNSDQ